MGGGKVARAVSSWLGLWKQMLVVFSQHLPFFSLTSHPFSSKAALSRKDLGTLITSDRTGEPGKLHWSLGWRCCQASCWQGAKEAMCPPTGR